MDPDNLHSKKEVTSLKFTNVVSSKNFFNTKVKTKDTVTEDVQNLISSPPFWLQAYICLHQELISLRYL